MKIIFLLESVVAHEDFADCFDCLGLSGYKRVGEYYSKFYLKNLRKTHKFYIQNYQKIIFNEDTIICHQFPENYVIPDIFDKWLFFIGDMKSNFEKMYISCVQIGEIPSSILIGEYINQISEEEKTVSSIFENIKTLDFEPECIRDEQSYYHDLYKSRRNNSKNP